ncbi:GntR family transcriptional regulator [Paenibacillus lupini]|uniref:GntR family transcriptional regulator n=1 Tax=Paenibacillus lupini TaxID=1450204 RepID=UPI00141EB744|nr:GntR family transcriptional regulator [Paenibacillus lupini]NIK23041.1 GntR family transcriptional regulator [Paenibacillus lupini]
MLNKYVEISKVISDEIDQNLFAESNKLPTEKSLATRFEVSRETIRKALKHLIEQGKIYNVKSSGYYLRRNGLHMASTLNKFSSITDLIRNANLSEGDIEVQIFKRKPNEEEMNLLNINKQDSMFILERIRTANGESIVYSRNILPQSIVGKDFAELYEPGSLSKHLKQKCGVHIIESLMEIQAVREDDVLPYRLKQSDPPLLKTIQVHYDDKAKPIYISYDFMRNDLIRFYIRRT